MFAAYITPHNKSPFFLYITDKLKEDFFRSVFCEKLIANEKEWSFDGVNQVHVYYFKLPCIDRASKLQQCKRSNVKLMALSMYVSSTSVCFCILKKKVRHYKLAPFFLITPQRLNRNLGELAAHSTPSFVRSISLRVKVFC